MDPRPDEDEWFPAADPAVAARLVAVRLGTFAAACVLYALACALPALQGENDAYTGFQCLTWWPWVRDYLAWWGNFAALTGAVLLLAERYSLACASGSVACGLALTAPAQWPGGVLSGYFLWVASFGLLAAGAGYCAYHRALTGRAPVPPPWW